MVVIDGFALLFLPGGIKSYLIALLKALNVSEQAKKNTFVILIPKIDKKLAAFYHKEIDELEKSLDSHFTFQYVPLSPALFMFYRVTHASDALIRRYTLFFWEHYYLPKVVNKLHPKVVLHPYQALSNYKTSARKVVVIHDIFHWAENQDYSFVVKSMYDTYKNGCINADTIITISQTSKDEIVQFLGVDEKNVVVCYEGVDDIFVTFKPSAEKEREVVSYYNLPKKYLLGLVSAREYKNVKGVLETFHLVSKKDPEMKLVLTGWAVVSNATIREYLHIYQLEGKVVMIPKIRTHEDLLYLYQLSYAFLFPSFKEGFGLPPLEAIACNTLAITSNVSAVGEIYNGVLPTFTPTDYTGAAAYMQSLTQAKRHDTIVSAQEKLLPKYTWKNVLPQYLIYLI